MSVQSDADEAWELDIQRANTSRKVAMTGLALATVLAAVVTFSVAATTRHVDSALLGFTGIGLLFIAILAAFTARPVTSAAALIDDDRGAGRLPVGLSAARTAACVMCANLSVLGTLMIIMEATS
ncbi:MAG: hypothetical protein ACJATT_003122 [Myxococcota bacterium]|jgi:hypothetical protein